MKIIFKILMIAGILVIPTYSQVNQIEGKFIYHPNQDKIFSQDGYGAGVSLTTNLGEYIKLLNFLDFEKTRQGDTLNNFSQRDITFQSTVRLYPVEEYFKLKPFVQGGIRARFNKFKATTIFPLLVNSGFLSTDQKNTYTSPTLGVGVNYKDYYILDYSHLFPDFSSKIEFFMGFFNFARERGDVLQAKAFIPLGDKFLFTPSYKVSRTKFEFFDYQFDHKLSFGIAIRFDEEKHQYSKTPKVK